MSDSPPEQKSIAIISDKQLGDVTLLEPLTRLLSARSGQPCALYVREAFRPLVELMSDAIWGPDTAVTHDEVWATSWSSKSVFRTWKTRAKRKCLLVIHANRSRWWYRLVFHQIRVETIILFEHWAHYFWRVFGGLESAFSPSRLKAPPDSWRHPALPETPYCLINPTAAWPTKFWPVEAWANFLASPEARGRTWVMTGGTSPEEKEHCTAIAKMSPPGLINLAGETSMKQYLHALSRASAVICVDGSAAHLAQAMGVATLVIFGPVAPGKWHWPTPKNRSISAFDFSQERLPPTSAVPVDAVLQEWRSLLAVQAESVAS
jgi:ADP-heptose:LPS heptosyltransferase